MYKGTPIRLSADFSAGQKEVAWYSQNAEKKQNKTKNKNLPTKNILPCKVVIQNWKRDRIFQTSKSQRSSFL